ncbi:MAG: YHS domain-containing protein [Candidatus Omnitrophica bacterium]|jgi:Cu+-exporting ATPase|nr:YHS domain-containing protein [Candidatus Omnitrophota bacterium]MDD5527018.1 YHS domain-containing protein [Candidatus Omnitrophota bacterium]
MGILVILAVAAMALILFVFARKASNGCCCGWEDNGKNPGGKQKDPVCGKEVDPDKAAAKISMSGRTFFFCSLECKEEFGRNSGKYLDNGGKDKQCGCCD